MSTTVAAEKRDQAKAASEALAAVPRVEGVCVFGSVARGRADVGSDIDLLVLGTDERLTSSTLLRQLPAELRVARISIFYHTADSLDRYLHRWSRFGAHLRQESWILYDPHGELRRVLATDIPVATTEELAAQRRHLTNYAHLDRFGGRFLFPLTHLYRIGRTVAFAILAERGTLEFDRGRAFRAIAELYPDRAADVATIARLAPFYERVTRRPSDGLLPFDPVGCEGEVIRARDAITRLLMLGDQRP
ncbi:MAG: nucleotidyltransferase domain-containing protein [Pseudonocardiales bacterium]